MRLSSDRTIRELRSEKELLADAAERRPQPMVPPPRGDACDGCSLSWRVPTERVITGRWWSCAARWTRASRLCARSRLRPRLPAANLLCLYRRQER